MSSEPILRVAGLAKSYRLYDDPRQRLWEALCLGRRKLHREFWALRDISFTVGRGESLGIIGRNGSGKSTLLQCIAGTLEPTAGTVAVRGRVAALLELGSGFNPEFTGRENVLLACAVLGLSRREAQERFAAIAEFADIGEFLDQPVKTYSSGMAVRLAFAVQTAVEPDLLIVDEALAVGDIFFQQKCLARMRALREQGVAILFVSHDMGLVRDLCGTALYLRDGRPEFLGQSQQAVMRYYHSVNKESAGHDCPCPAAGQDVPLDGPVAEVQAKAVWIGGETPAPGAVGVLQALAVLDGQGQPTMRVVMGEAVRFFLLYRVFSDEELDVSIVLKNRYDQLVNATGTYMYDGPRPRPDRDGYLLFELGMTCMVEAGEYTFAGFLGRSTERPNRGETLEQTPWLGPLRVEWDYDMDKAPFIGMFGLPCNGRYVFPESE